MGILSKNIEVDMPRFTKPSNKELIEIGLLFNDGKLDENLAGMLAMCEFVIDRLYENGDIRKPSSKEI